MRVWEITGLRWDDINLDEGTINVNHTLVYYDKGTDKGCWFSINTPKTKAGQRTIPMLPKVKQAFLMEKEYQKEYKKLNKKYNGKELENKIKYNLYKKGFSLNDIDKIQNKY